MMRLDLGKGPWGPGLGVGEKALTPLDTAWHRCCIQSAISASLSALSSRQGRSARMTWKAWGRSVVLDLRQPPHCSPLGQRRRVRRVEEAGVAQGSSWAGRGLKTWGCPRVWGAGGHQRVVQTPQLGSPTPTLFCVAPLISRITKVLPHTEQGQVRGGESALSPTLSESAHVAPRGPDGPSRCVYVHLPLRSGASQGKDCLPIRLDPFQAGSSFCLPQVPLELSRPQGTEWGWG